MSFWKNLFQKKNKKTKSNENKSIKINRNFSYFLSHKPNGEKLQLLWEKNKVIVEEEEKIDWFCQFSHEFIENYQEWRPQRVNKKEIEEIFSQNLKDEEFIELIKSDQVHSPELISVVLEILSKIPEDIESRKLNIFIFNFKLKQFFMKNYILF
eukprot:Anaeramoba_ignava/c16364_g1_i2.p2 GENE.c16364_g1_i2~~c16364_g1_i2.p2  ORF type:complete len:162 (+),score=48.04 c16364_g1_i2:26-487(+)